jgi:hypothetical protein
VTAFSAPPRSQRLGQGPHPKAGPDPNNAFDQYSTRAIKNLYLPSIHLMKYAKGPYVNGIKVLNRLPQTIKNLEHCPVKFKNALKKKFPSAPFLFNQGIFRTRESCKGII